MNAFNTYLTVRDRCLLDSIPWAAAVAAGAATAAVPLSAGSVVYAAIVSLPCFVGVFAALHFAELQPPTSARLPWLFAAASVPLVLCNPLWLILPGLAIGLGTGLFAWGAMAAVDSEPDPRVVSARLGAAYLLTVTALLVIQCISCASPRANTLPLVAPALLTALAGMWLLQSLATHRPNREDPWIENSIAGGLVVELLMLVVFL